MGDSSAKPNEWGVVWSKLCVEQVSLFAVTKVFKMVIKRLQDENITGTEVESGSGIERLLWAPRHDFAGLRAIPLGCALILCP